MRIAELVARYHDLPLGTVDASVVALELGARQDVQRGDWYWNGDDKLTLDDTVGDRWELMPQLLASVFRCGIG
jgi:hypothetical protein